MCTVTRMRDGEIQAALHARLVGEHQGEPDTRFLDELSLCGLVRVDVAVINGTLAGHELKSDRDTLRRLPAQVEVYSKVLDRATFVVGEGHHDHALGCFRGGGVIMATCAAGADRSAGRPSQLVEQRGRCLRPGTAVVAGGSAGDSYRAWLGPGGPVQATAGALAAVGR